MDSTIIAAIIGAIAVIVAAVIGVLTHKPKQKENNSTSDTTQKSLPRKYLFIVGCGVGNRVGILPLPPGLSNSPELDEFIDALEHIGLLDNPAIRPIIKARDILTSPNSASLVELWGQLPIILSRTFF